MRLRYHWTMSDFQSAPGRWHFETGEDLELHHLRLHIGHWYNSLQEMGCMIIVPTRVDSTPVRSVVGWGIRVLRRSIQQRNSNTLFCPAQAGRFPPRRRNGIMPPLTNNALAERGNNSAFPIGHLDNLTILQGYLENRPQKS